MTDCTGSGKVRSYITTIRVSRRAPMAIEIPVTIPSQHLAKTSADREEEMVKASGKGGWLDEPLDESSAPNRTLCPSPLVTVECLDIIWGQSISHKEEERRGFGIASSATQSISAIKVDSEHCRRHSAQGLGAWNVERCSIALVSQGLSMWLCENFSTTPRWPKCLKLGVSSMPNSEDTPMFHPQVVFSKAREAKSKCRVVHANQRVVWQSLLNFSAEA